uniref:cytokinin dehydrogenase n=1 Tax=Araucaria cunninghamii TaxID=56994 RepID=A0A0D6QWB7_ARACU
MPEGNNNKRGGPEEDDKEESHLRRKIIDRTFVAARTKLSAMKFPARNLLVMLIVFLERIVTRCIISNSENHHRHHHYHHHLRSSSAASTKISGRSSSKVDCGTSLSSLELEGAISLYETEIAAKDFGGIYHHKPAAIVIPACVEDILKVVTMVAASPNLTVAAKGNGHSISGQAQALNGLVLDMSSMKGTEIFEGSDTESPYVDAFAGELWVDVLRATLKVGLTPRSWTDYLYLSVGGTLSNGGISGQAFKFGPQISNVLQMDVVTGTGEVITCSAEQSEDLFYGALGGLGQFGIITRARILLQRAPDMVRWIRVVYAEFEDFREDQELLISRPGKETFDYVEGFVLANNEDPINGWPSVLLSSNSSFDLNSIPPTAGPMLYCLEVALHYDHATDYIALNKRMDSMLAPLRFIRGLQYSIDLPYFDFLNRVHQVEIEARASGIWDAPHPWMNMFVPKSKISEFDAKVFREILKHGVGGPMLVYPVSKNKWDSRMSVIVPEEEEIFYLVALLRFSPPYPAGPPLQTLLAQNEEIIHYCISRGIDMKLYIPHYKTEAEWKRHFGRHWHQFLQRKITYDPQAILAPGHRIFARSI